MATVIHLLPDDNEWEKDEERKIEEEKKKQSEELAKYNIE